MLWLSVRTGVSFRKRRRILEENEWDDFGIIMAAILTLLGFIIGFSFSMAITRYDHAQSPNSRRKMYNSSVAVHCCFRR